MPTIYVIRLVGRAVLGRPAIEALNIIGTIREANSAAATKYRNLCLSLFGKRGRLEHYTVTRRYCSISSCSTA